MRCLIIIVLIFVFDYSLGQNISVKRKWTCNVRANHIGDAGEDYDRNYESGRGKVRLAIEHTFGNEIRGYNWDITVSKQDINWDQRLKIFARRTNEGTPVNYYTSYMVGGETYMQIEDFEKIFFSGFRGHTNIKIQYKIEGVSVLIPVDVYRTNIVYTVTSD